MVTLCMDTSHKYLTLAIIKDHQLLDFHHELCFKKQSEGIFIELDALMKKNGLEPKDIDSVCVAVGPGSYTGIRISMTIAKTLCSLKNIPLYKISTLALYANNQPNTMVLLDARSKRAYCGIYNYSNILKDDFVEALDTIDFKDSYQLVGDLSLIGKEDFYYNHAESFLNTIDSWRKVENIDLLVPSYLKEQKEYMNV
ncbi:MAG: tRNA (adenosine(37)-N6)-threonylcarbamoyltransferase complex dimerization subunit type 1 TsaB [Erysipelotrichaceae bacterium]